MKDELNINPNEINIIENLKEVNSLIKKYEDAKKLMKTFSSPSFMKKNKRFKGLF